MIVGLIIYGTAGGIILAIETKGRAPGLAILVWIAFTGMVGAITGLMIRTLGGVKAGAIVAVAALAIPGAMIGVVVGEGAMSVVIPGVVIPVAIGVAVVGALAGGLVEMTALAIERHHWTRSDLASLVPSRATVLGAIMGTILGLMVGGSIGWLLLPASTTLWNDVGVVLMHAAPLGIFGTVLGAVLGVLIGRLSKRR